MATALTLEQTLVQYIVQHPNLVEMYSDKFERGIFLEQLSQDIYKDIRAAIDDTMEVNKYTLARKYGEALEPYTKLPVTEKTAIAKIEGLIKAQIEYYSRYMISKKCSQFSEKEQAGELISIDSFVSDLVNLTSVTNEAETYGVAPMVDYLLDKIQNPQKELESGMSTGYSCLDDVFKGGLKKKQVVVFLGQSGMGKTTVVENIILNLSLRHKGIFFSLEMPREDVWEDCFGILAGARMSNVIQKNDYVPNMDDFMLHVHKMKDKFFIVDSADLSIQAIHRMVKMHKIRHKIDFIVIDHYHIIKKPNRPTEQEQYNEISRALKIIAKEEDITVIVLAQMNRGSEERKIKNPLLKDLKGASSLVENADAVLGFYRPSWDITQRGDVPPPEVAPVIEITLPKGRRIKSEKILMRIDWESGKLTGELSEFEEIDYKRVLQLLDSPLSTSVKTSSFKKS